MFFLFSVGIGPSHSVQSRNTSRMEGFGNTVSQASNSKFFFFFMDFYACGLFVLLIICSPSFGCLFIIKTFRNTPCQLFFLS